MTNNLATASVSSRLSGVAGRAMISARGHHLIVDSPLSLGGPNEELNPIDLLLGALATCGTFICETAAREKNIPLHQIAVAVAGDFDPRGICGEPVDPSIQALRVRVSLSGPSQAEAAILVEEFKKRCPVYGTLVGTAPIEIDSVVDAPRPEQE